MCLYSEAYLVLFLLLSHKLNHRYGCIASSHFFIPLIKFYDINNPTVFISLSYMLREAIKYNFLQGTFMKISMLLLNESKTALVHTI